MSRYQSYTIFFFLAVLMGITVVNIADAYPQEIEALCAEIDRTL